MHTVLTVVLSIFLIRAASAADFTGQVVGVLDGDTIEVLHKKHPERIRLNGIDCPEKGQAYGKKAKQAASELVFGKQVTLQTHGLDKYGRTIADVFLPNGTNVNHELVKDGWCWWYRKYAPGNMVLEELERRARASGLGLWAESHPVEKLTDEPGLQTWLYIFYRWILVLYHANAIAIRFDVDTAHFFFLEFEPNHGFPAP